MREIKFRAFNKELRKMVYPGARGWFDRVIKSKKNGVLNTITVQLLILGDYPEVELLQYTGLKDKKGVEIYEGDIFWEWEDGLYRWIVQWNGELGRWELRESDIAEIFYEEDMLATIENGELKGNIHENPELLEVPK